MNTPSHTSSTKSQTAFRSDFGILQGRLSHSDEGLFQFYPKNWQKEFYLAKELGFQAIEWLLDWPEWEQNDFLKPEKANEILKIVQDTGVSVNSVCADYLMKFRLDGTEAKQWVALTSALVKAAARLTKNKLILIPMLEQNAYPTESEKDEFIKNLLPVVHEAESLGVRLGFETEMPVPHLVRFLDKFQSAAVGVYYDVGNCTSYGFDTATDIRDLGPRVFGVHLKDRKVHKTQSMTLGTGDANLKGVFESLAKIGFSGVPIMQAWRGEDYLQDAKVQLKVLKNLVSG
jgi:L-ribulose-5-phosphate 3-epimerase